MRTAIFFIAFVLFMIFIDLKEIQIFSGEWIVLEIFLGLCLLNLVDDWLKKRPEKNKKMEVNNDKKRDY